MNKLTKAFQLFPRRPNFLQNASKFQFSTQKGSEKQSEKEAPSQSESQKLKSAMQKPGYAKEEDFLQKNNLDKHSYSYQNHRPIHDEDENKQIDAYDDHKDHPTSKRFERESGSVVDRKASGPTQKNSEGYFGGASRQKDDKLNNEQISARERFSEKSKGGKAAQSKVGRPSAVDAENRESDEQLNRIQASEDRPGRTPMTEDSKDRKERESPKSGPASTGGAQGVNAEKQSNSSGASR